MNMSVVRVDMIVSSLTYACVWTQRRWLEKEKRSRECSFAKCDIRFVGKRQAHSNLFNFFPPVAKDCLRTRLNWHLTCQFVHTNMDNTIKQNNVVYNRTTPNKSILLSHWKLQSKDQREQNKGKMLMTVSEYDKEVHNLKLFSWYLVCCMRIWCTCVCIGSISSGADARSRY